VFDLPDLDLLVLPGMPEALASREIATVYRLLSKHGVPQRQIAAATGQSQSEVCEVCVILKGRQVQAYDVLVRICAGLGVPREVMGLGFGAYAVDSPARQPDGEERSRRAAQTVCSPTRTGGSGCGRHSHPRCGGAAGEPEDAGSGVGCAFARRPS
jgi:hypothetical protein